MSGGDHYTIARNNLPYLESHYSAAFALFQNLGDDDSVHEYGTFRDLPIGEIRITLRHFVFMCDEKGYEVEFRGDVGENYVRGMTAVKKCKNAMRWMQSKMVLFQRMPGAALEERWTQTGMSSITSVCCRRSSE